MFAVATVHGYQLSKTADYIGAMFYVGAICAFAAIPSSVAAAITIGTPILLLWRRRGYNSILAYLLAGVLISVIVALVLTISRRVFSDFLWLDSASEPTGKRFLFVGRSPVSVQTIWVDRVLSAASNPSKRRSGVLRIPRGPSFGGLTWALAYRRPRTAASWQAFPRGNLPLLAECSHYSEGTAAFPQR